MAAAFHALTGRVCATAPSGRSLDICGPLDLRCRTHLGFGRLQDGVAVTLRPGGRPRFALGRVVRVQGRDLDALPFLQALAECLPLLPGLLGQRQDLGFAGDQIRRLGGRRSGSAGRSGSIGRSG